MVFRYSIDENIIKEYFNYFKEKRCRINKTK